MAPTINAPEDAVIKPGSTILITGVTVITLNDDHYTALLISTKRATSDSTQQTNSSNAATKSEA